VIDHLGFSVGDFAASKAFYEQALAPLGYSVMIEFPDAACGFGAAGKPDFWLETRTSPAGALHVAFASPDHETVDAFYEAALAAGGTDNGKPGPRRQYHEHYYGAYVLDPDGNNIEAVCHRPE
jgi:catechol 2,3-dioxygenase-like lactoylglutathione lyase family enzyme